jgi:hypothetical protein
MEDVASLNANADDCSEENPTTAETVEKLRIDAGAGRRRERANGAGDPGGPRDSTASTEPPRTEKARRAAEPYGYQGTQPERAQIADELDLLCATAPSPHGGASRVALALQRFFPEEHDAVGKSIYMAWAKKNRPEARRGHEQVALIEFETVWDDIRAEPDEEKLSSYPYSSVPVARLVTLSELTWMLSELVLFVGSSIEEWPEQTVRRGTDDRLIYGPPKSNSRANISAVLSRAGVSPTTSLRTDTVSSGSNGSVTTSSSATPRSQGPVIRDQPEAGFLQGRSARHCPHDDAAPAAGIPGR